MTPASSATPRTSPFGAAAVDDEAHRLGRDGDRAPRRRRGGRSTACRETSTMRGRPRPVDVGEAAAFGARGVGRPSGPCWSHRSWPRSGAVEPPERDLGAGRAASASASGMTASASAAASAERTWLPCPPAAGQADADAALRVADRGARRRRARRRRGGTRAGRGSCDTASPRTARSTGRSRSRAAREARGSPGGRTARTSRRSRPGCRAARRARTGGAAAGPLGAVPNANGLPGWTATRQRSIRADRLERGLDDVVRARPRRRPRR